MTRDRTGLKRTYPMHTVDAHDPKVRRQLTRFYDPTCIESMWQEVDVILADAMALLVPTHPIIKKLNSLQAHMRLAHEEKR